MSKKLEVLAKRIERMQTPDKLRLAAEILEKTNDVDMALAVISQAVEHLMFVQRVASKTSPR
jgi:hypothetical protein